MARVTVQDCVKIVDNRFKFVALASKRAKDISSGSPINVNRDNDKNPVVALREIAESKINIDALYKSFLQSLHKNQKLSFEKITESVKDEYKPNLTEEIIEEIKELSSEGSAELDESLDFSNENTLEKD